MLKYNFKIGKKNDLVQEIKCDSLYMSPDLTFISGITSSEYGLVNNQPIFVREGNSDEYKKYVIQTFDSIERGYIIFDKQPYKVNEYKYNDNAAYGIIFADNKKYIADNNGNLYINSINTISGETMVSGVTSGVTNIEIPTKYYIYDSIVTIGGIDYEVDYDDESPTITLKNGTKLYVKNYNKKISDNLELPHAKKVTKFIIRKNLDYKVNVEHISFTKPYKYIKYNIIYNEKSEIIRLYLLSKYVDGIEKFYLVNKDYEIYIDLSLDNKFQYNPDVSINTLVENKPIGTTTATTETIYEIFDEWRNINSGNHIHLYLDDSKYSFKEGDVIKAINRSIGEKEFYVEKIQPSKDEKIKKFVTINGIKYFSNGEKLKYLTYNDNEYEIFSKTYITHDINDNEIETTQYYIMYDNTPLLITINMEDLEAVRVIESEEMADVFGNTAKKGIFSVIFTVINQTVIVYKKLEDGTFENLNLNVGENEQKDLKFGFSMGEDNKSASYIKSINVKNFDTSNITDMSYMFNNCSSLTNLDLSSFNIFNVTNMSNMFNNCSSLKEIKCKPSFKKWCLANQDDISLPESMRDNGDGVWDVIEGNIKEYEYITINNENYIIEKQTFINGENKAEECEVIYYTINDPIRLIVINVVSSNQLRCILANNDAEDTSTLSALVNSHEDYTFELENPLFDKGNVENEPSNYSEYKNINYRIYKSISNINIPLKLNNYNGTNINQEYVCETDFFNVEKEKSINRIVDMEKDVYYPGYFDSEKNQFKNIDKIIIDLHFRTRDLETWKINNDIYGDNNLYNANTKISDIVGCNWNILDYYNLNPEPNSLKPYFNINNEKYRYYQPSDLLYFLNFTDDDVFYQKSKIGKSFLRLSFYDTPDSRTQSLLYTSTVFMNEGNLYKKFINNRVDNGLFLSVDNVQKKSNRIITKNIGVNYEEVEALSGSNLDYSQVILTLPQDDDLTLYPVTMNEDNRLSSSFVIENMFECSESSEGFYLYLFREYSTGIHERDIYLKVEFNHAGVGRTVTFMQPFKTINDEGDREMLNMSDSNDVSLLKKGCKLQEMYDHIYIKIHVKYDFENKRYYYYLPEWMTKHNDNKKSEMRFNLYELKIADESLTM